MCVYTAGGEGVMKGAPRFAGSEAIDYPVSVKLKRRWFTRWCRLRDDRPEQA